MRMLEDGTLVRCITTIFVCTIVAKQSCYNEQAQVCNNGDEIMG
jgi:hypothetical protein